MNHGTQPEFRSLPYHTTRREANCPRRWCDVEIPDLIHNPGRREVHVRASRPVQSAGNLVRTGVSGHEFSERSVGPGDMVEQPADNPIMEGHESRDIMVRG